MRLASGKIVFWWSRSARTAARAVHQVTGKTVVRVEDRLGSQYWPPTDAELRDLLGWTEGEGEGEGEGESG